jgi:hypothetical protein
MPTQPAGPRPALPGKAHSYARNASNSTCPCATAAWARSSGTKAPRKTSAVRDCYSRPMNRCSRARNWKSIWCFRRRLQGFRQLKLSAVEKSCARSNRTAPLEPGAGRENPAVSLSAWAAAESVGRYMWGQPPSAVQRGVARGGSACRNWGAPPHALRKAKRVEGSRF